MRQSDVSSLVMMFMLHDNLESKISIWKELCLDRGAIFVSLKIFLESLTEYELACNCEGPVPKTYENNPIAYYLYVTQQQEQILKTTRPLMPVIYALGMAIINKPVHPIGSLAIRQAEHPLHLLS